MLYTPGHTDDSYSFLMPDRVFTGDTLLIRGTGRTDFQNGEPRAQYESLFGKLLKLPEETLVYPAHDYKGDTVSTIGEEKALQSAPAGQVGRRVRRPDEQPQPAQSEDDGRGGSGKHARQGLAQDEIARRGWAVTAAAGNGLVGQPDVVLIDLREKQRAREARSNSRLAARALPRPAGEHRRGRHAA